MIKNLPFWHLTNKYPSFLDVDSKTSVEMVARVYGAMQEVITDYNTLVEGINKTISDFGIENEEFKKCITELIENYIKLIDDKIKLQDQKIQNGFDEAIKQAIETGKVVAESVYEEGTENLLIKLSYKE